MATQDHVASVFLRALGAPDTKDMRAAVKAWMRAEGVQTSGARNNPWNLHAGPVCNSSSHYCTIPTGTGLPGQIGTYNAGPGDKNVAVFDTLDHGVQASANNLIRLSGSGYGYDHVITKARAGDPVGFLNALALSSWSAGRYGTKSGGDNKLLLIYATITGYKIDPQSYKSLPWYTSGVSNQAPSGEHAGNNIPTPPSLYDLGVIPDGKTVTPDDVMKLLRAAAASPNAEAYGFGTGPGFQSFDTIIAVANAALVGKPWNKATADALTAQLAGNAETAKANPMDPLAAIGGFIGKLSDPATWAKLLALMLGVGLAAYGGVNVYRATA